MKKTVLFFLLLSNQVFAQVDFRLGPQIGYADAGKNTSESFVTKDWQNKVERSLTHKNSFLAGIQAQLTWRRFFYFSAALQYQEKGSTYSEYVQSPGLANSRPYTSREDAVQKFKKICLPLSAGLTMKVGRFQPAVFAGVRPNYFVWGRYSSDVIYDSEDPLRDFQYTLQFKPLSGSKLGKMRLQYFYGVSLLCFDRLLFSFTVNKSEDLSYALGDQVYYKTTLRNHDYLFSIALFCGCKGGESAGFTRFGTVRFL